MRKLLGCAGLLLAGALVAACADTQDVVAPRASARVDVTQAAAPADLFTVNYGGPTLTLWPYTGEDFSGKPSDPMNLLFPGRTPREVRAALLSLNGDRSAYGMPNVFPFNCVWQDGVGGTNQTAYTTSAGWVGSDVQLTCGAYDPMRFHVRLFPAGAWGSIGATHMDMLIPGTIQHAVLSWTLPRNIVLVDLLRSGLLNPSAPLFPVPVGSATPTFRKVDPPDLYWYLHFNAPVLADQLDVQPLAQDDVRLNNDGAAIVFNFAGNAEAERVVARQAFTLQFDQKIPRPVCASGPYDYVKVVGPIDLRQQIVYTPSGNLVSQFHAEGKLAVTPVNPLTDEVIGETFQAILLLSNKNVVTDQTTLVAYTDVRMAMPASVFKGSLKVRVRVGPNSATVDSYDVSCD